MEFFLRGVVETANNAYEGAIRIVGLFRSDRDRIIASADQPNSLLRLHDLLQARPFLAASQVRQLTGLSIPTINKSFETLERLGVVREITGRRRGRVYGYDAFLKILDEGTAVV